MQKNVDGIKREFDKGSELFEKYLFAYGPKGEVAERINIIFEYCRENNPKFLSFIFKQLSAMMDMAGSPPVNTLKNEEETAAYFEKQTNLMKCMLFLLDSMDYAGYIKEEFLPEELKGKRESGIFSLQISQEIAQRTYDKNEADKKKKLKNKKDGK